MIVRFRFRIFEIRKIELRLGSVTDMMSHCLQERTRNVSQCYFDHQLARLGTCSVTCKATYLGVIFHRNRGREALADI